MINTKERFKQIAKFERPNDPSFFGILAWLDTYKRWQKERVPVLDLNNMKEINMHFLGYQDQNTETIIPNASIISMGPLSNPPWVPPICPVFETKTIKEEDNNLIKVDYDGAIIKVKKDNLQAMPQWLEYPVKDWKSWKKYKKRLINIDDPRRWPKGWNIMTDDKLNWPIKENQKGESFEKRDFPLGMFAFSLFGCARNYLGLENFSMNIYDNQSLILDIFETQTHLAYGMIKKVFDSGITIDWAWIWEDIAYNKGSLISTEFIKKYMVPHYKKIVNLLRNNGVTVIILDSDGNVDALIPIWLACGINAVFPLERASYMDGIKLRKKYGKDLIMIGNVDKRNLAKGKKEIDNEIKRIRRLIKYGGYFPACDHHIPPDVSYENIVYFLNEVHKLSEYEETKRIIKL